MAVSTQTEVDVEDYLELQEILREFPKKVNQSAARAINAGATTGRKLILKGVTSTLNVKRKDIAGKGRYGGVLLSKASASNPTAIITVGGRRIPVFRFKGKPKRPLPVKGIGYRVNQSGRRKRKTRAAPASWRIAKTGRYAGIHIAPDSFTAKMKSGHIGIFKRVVKKNRKLIELRGPSIPHVAIEDKKLQASMRVDVGEIIQKRLLSQIDLLWSQRNARLQLQFDRAEVA